MKDEESLNERFQGLVTLAEGAIQKTMHLIAAEAVPDKFNQHVLMLLCQQTSLLGGIYAELADARHRQSHEPDQPSDGESHTASNPDHDPDSSEDSAVSLL